MRGKVNAFSTYQIKAWDHPRTMRGKADTLPARRSAMAWDQPALCGEKKGVDIAIYPLHGDHPRTMRGKGGWMRWKQPSCSMRITPTLCGEKCVVDSITGKAIGITPALCGEKRARVGINVRQNAGITPALCGEKTRLCMRRPCNRSGSPPHYAGKRSDGYRASSRPVARDHPRTMRGKDAFEAEDNK